MQVQDVTHTQTHTTMHSAIVLITGRPQKLGVNAGMATPPAGPDALVRGLWEQLESTLRSAARAIEGKEREEKEARPALEARIARLTKIRDTILKEKEAYVDKHSPALAAKPTIEFENTFWARVGELDSSIRRVRSHRGF